MTPRELIAYHEGMELRPYLDSVGKMSIGVGRNLDDKGISTDEALYLFDNDMAEAQSICDQYEWFKSLSEARKAVMLSLAFNLGASRLAGFKRFLAAMSRGDWDLAAAELVDSKWHEQVGRRGRDLVELVKSETWPET